MPVIRNRNEQYKCWGEECPTKRNSTHNLWITHNVVRNVDWDNILKQKTIGRRWSNARNFLVDEKLNTTTAREFKYLSEKWKKETGGYSLIHIVTKNKNYKYIIDMGERVVPLIFKDLQNEPFYWFEALNQILKPERDPILKDHYGNLDKMAEDWLKWGIENQYIK